MPRPALTPAAGPRWRAVLAASALLGLAACAAWGPVADANLPGPALQLPEAWSAGGATGQRPAEALLAWWQRFDDPLLSSLVDSALQANTSILIARAALAQAAALRDGAAAGLWPTLGSSASVRNGTAGGQSTGNSLQAGLSANWVPDVAGGLRAAIDAGTARWQASSASLGDAQVQVATDVALSYLLLRSAQARQTIASDNLASQQETLQITAWREQAGLVTALETAQARAAAAQTAASLPALATAIAQASHALAVLTGQPPGALTGRLAAPGPIPQARGPLLPALPADTLRQRADVRRAEFAVAAALAGVAGAQARRQPSFAIGGSLGVNAATLAGLTQGASVVGALLASVSLPLLDGGASQAQVQAEQAALAQARQNYRAAVLAALKDVEDALAAWQGDQARAAALSQAAEAAAAAALMARQRFSSGLVDFQTVLQTQRTQLSTQDSLAGAQADLGADQVRLFQALGGGWQPAPAGSGAGTARPLLAARP